MAKHKFWQFKNTAEGTGELLLYGEIADSTWWGDEVTPKQFAADLTALGDIADLTVRINSVGGDVFAAHAIYNLLQAHAATVTVRVDGLAASAATIIAMAGDAIIMPVNSMMMIHNPMTVAWGNADEMRKTADTLDTIRESIISAYMTRTAMAHDEIVTLMDNETWMTAQEAVDNGFATQVENAVQVAASATGTVWNVNGVRMDMSRFTALPDQLLPHDAASADAVAPVADTAEAPTEVSASAGMTVTALEAAHPQLVAEIRNAARADGIAEERARQAALDELVTDETAGIVSAARRDGSTPEATSLLIVRAMKASGKGAAFLAARLSDADASGVNTVAANVGITGGNSDDAERAKFIALAKANTERQGERR